MGTANLIIQAVIAFGTIVSAVILIRHRESKAIAWRTRTDDRVNECIRRLDNHSERDKVSDERAEGMSKEIHEMRVLMERIKTILEFAHGVKPNDLK